MIVPMVEGGLKIKAWVKCWRGFVVATIDFYVKKGMHMTYKVSHIMYILSSFI